MSRPARRRSAGKPWPMKWIVVAILVCVVPYTYLNLKYRKPNPASEPYADMKNRAGVMRLLAAGYQRIELTALRPMDPRTFQVERPAATSIAIPGGLPPVLSETLIDKPLVPADILSVQATAAISTGMPYIIQFTCAQPQLAEQFANVEAYVHGDKITIVPDFELLEGELQSRFLEITVQLSVPAGMLKPGHYEVTLVGARGSRQWTLDVR